MPLQTVSVMTSERRLAQCREATRRWREKNREFTRVVARKWYWEHRDQAIEKARKYRAEHPEKIREHNKKWNEIRPSRPYRNTWKQHFKVSIPKGYAIHHKDQDRSNNDPTNLLCLPIAEHARLHNMLKETNENLQTGK